MKIAGRIFWFLWVTFSFFVFLVKASADWHIAGDSASTMPFVREWLTCWFVFGIVPYMAWKSIK